MTVTSWVDVPAGMPMHHHCVVSVESAHDPKHWVDASTTPDALVAWQYPDAVAWVRDQFAARVDEADLERRGDLEVLLASYEPAAVGPDVRHYGERIGTDAYLPGMWERLPETFQTGRWAIETYQLGPGRKLVLQVFAFADRGQPAGRHTVCDRHQRPEDSPYLGLTASQVDHYATTGLTLNGGEA